MKQSQELYNQHAERLWNHASYAIKNGYAPTADETADLKAMAPLVTKPELVANMQDGLSKLQTGAAVRGMTIAQQKDMATTLQTLGTGGQLDNLGRHLAVNLTDIADKQATLAKNQPVTYAQQTLPAEALKALPPVAPLDLSSPTAFATGLQARQQLKGAAQKKDPAVGDSVLTPADQTTVLGALRSGGPQAQLVLSGLQGTLKPEEMGAALTTQGLKEAVVGMARSSDPAKMDAAFRFMDAQERANPRLFKAQFGDASDDLTRWQGLLRWMPPDDVPKAMLRYTDPTQRATLKASDEAASELLKTVTPAQVAAKFNTWSGFLHGTNPGLPAPIEGNAAGELTADYKSAFREEFAKSGDASVAESKAVKDIGAKYGVSPLNGYQVMARPPETVVNPKTNQPFYPAIDGSTGWMKSQLDTALREHFSTQAMNKYPGDRGSQAAYYNTLKVADHRMRADDTTEAEIASGRPPSYLVGVKSAEDGMWHALTTVNERGQTVFRRFRPDVDAAKADAERHAAEVAQGVRDAAWGGKLGPVPPN